MITFLISKLLQSMYGLSYDSYMIGAFALFSGFELAAAVFVVIMIIFDNWKTISYNWFLFRQRRRDAREDAQCKKRLERLDIKGGDKK